MNRPILLAALGGALTGFCHAIGEYVWGAAVNKLVPVAQSDFWTPLLKLFPVNDTLLHLCFAGEATGLLICLLAALQLTGVVAGTRLRPIPPRWLWNLGLMWAAGLLAGMVLWNTHVRDVWRYDDVLDSFRYVQDAALPYLCCLVAALLASQRPRLEPATRITSIVTVGLTLPMAVLSGFRLFTWLGYEATVSWMGPVMQATWDWREICYLAPGPYLVSTIMLGLAAATTVAASLCGRWKVALPVGLAGLLLIHGMFWQHDLACDLLPTMGLSVTDAAVTTVVRLDGQHCVAQPDSAQPTWRTADNLQRLRAIVQHQRPSSILVQNAVALLADDALLSWNEDAALRYLLSDRPRGFGTMKAWSFAIEALAQRPATPAAVELAQTLSDSSRWMAMGTLPFVSLSNIFNHFGLSAEADHYRQLGDPDHTWPPASPAPVAGTVTGRVVVDGVPAQTIPLLLVPQGSPWLTDQDVTVPDMAHAAVVSKFHDSELDLVGELADTVHATTTADGTFRFDTVPEGRYVLCLRLPGRHEQVSLTAPFTALDLTPGHTAINVDTVTLSTR